MEWVEVADTAVKIGLGAAVTGVTAYFIAARNQKHDFEKEYFKRRQDLLEKVAERFEEIHMFFFDVSIQYGSYVSGYVKGISPVQADRDKYFDYIKKIGDLLRDLHVQEGRLLLAGIKDGTNILREYRLLATDVNDMIKLDDPVLSEESVSQKSEELCAKKDQFYKVLSKVYRRACKIFCVKIFYLMYQALKTKYIL